MQHRTRRIRKAFSCTARYVAVMLPAALALSIACSDATHDGHGTATSAVARLRHDKARSNASSDVASDAGTCSPPDIAGGLVGPTGTYVNACETGNGHCAPMGPADYALDYGDVVTAEGEPIGSFYFVVIAPGYENGGFVDGAPGNLSDAFPSAAPGDRGSGDTIADRTIVSNGSPPIWALDSSGTHTVSFPPSNFEAIQLMPFDLTRDGQYVIALCRTGAKASCDCVFEKFAIAVADAGTPTPGTGGTSGSGGVPESGGSSGDTGTAGASNQGGASNGAGGAPNAGGSFQSGSGGAAGCAGAAGSTASGGVSGSGGATSSGGASVDAGVPCITGSGGKAPSAGGASSDADAGADCGVASME